MFQINLKQRCPVHKSFLHILEKGKAMEMYLFCKSFVATFFYDLVYAKRFKL